MTDLATSPAGQSVVDPSACSPHAPRPGWSAPLVESLLAAKLSSNRLRELLVSFTPDELLVESDDELASRFQPARGSSPLDVTALRELLAACPHQDPDLAPHSIGDTSQVRCLLLGTPDYPAALDASPAPPLLLYVRGSLVALATPGIALVGTRRPSGIAKGTVPATVAAAVELSLPIVSGLALGVDAMAHDAAIAAGLPTVAVLASHPSHPTPKSNTDLAERILAAGGALVSEQPPATSSASAQALVARNRIIAGLASCLVPAEASLRSGTMHAVAAAFRASRPVVVPIPRATAHRFEGAEGLLALAGLRPLPPEVLRLDAALQAHLDAGPHPANAVAETREELRQMLRLAHLFSPVS